MRVRVVGAGSWGTALALLLGRGGHGVDLVCHTGEQAERMARDGENREYLAGFRFPEQVCARGPGEELGEVDFVVVAVPSGSVSDVLGFVAGCRGVCLASKGLEHGTGRVLSEVVEGASGGAPVAVLSGPNLALEVARGIPTAAVSACPDEGFAMLVRAAFSGPTFRVYISDDRRGVELAGGLKNVYAIGAGMSDGLGFGDNTKGAFLARGLAEMSRLGLALGARMETFLGLAGVGDLFATASSKLSRNYRVGFALGQGSDLGSAVAALGQVAEGVSTCEAALRLAAEAGVEVPLMEALWSVMAGDLGTEEAIRRLMGRSTAREQG